MYTQVNKAKENSFPTTRQESRAIANSVAQKKPKSKVFRFKDNRDGVIVQSKQKAMVNQTLMNQNAYKSEKKNSPIQYQKGNTLKQDFIPINSTPHGSTMQRVLKTAGEDTIATTLLGAAQLVEGFGIWTHYNDLAVLQGVSSVVDITYSKNNVVVTIDGIAATGSPFRTIVGAIAALKNQVFVSLDDDRTSERYTFTALPCDKIRKKSGEILFASQYSDGKSVDDAVEEAIAGLDLTGSTTAKHSRHDFQPSSAAVMNLQVQLGGSAGDYRRGMGDTSSTLVTISTAKWTELLNDERRLKKVIQEAHRQSFINQTKIHIQ